MKSPLRLLALLLPLFALPSTAQDTISLPLIEPFTSWPYSLTDSLLPHDIHYKRHNGWDICTSGIQGTVLGTTLATGDRHFALILVENSVGNTHTGAHPYGGTTLATPYFAETPTHISFSVNTQPPDTYGNVYLPADTLYLEVGYVDDTIDPADINNYCQYFHPLDTFALRLRNRWEHLCLDLPRYLERCGTFHRFALRSSNQFYPRPDASPDANSVFCWVFIDSLYIASHPTLSCDTLLIYDTLCQHTAYDRYGLTLPADSTVIAGDHLFALTLFRTVHLLHLHILPNPVDTLTEHLWPGDTLRFADTLLTTPGLYTFHATGANGCDSTTILHLSYHPWDPSHTYINPRTSHPCDGDSVTLVAFGAPWIHWISEPYDPDINHQQGSDTLRVAPRQTTVYYLMQLDSTLNPEVSATVDPRARPQPCLQIEPTTIDYERPTVGFTDCSEGSTSSRWTLPDGTTLDGPSHRLTLRRPLPDTLHLHLTSCSATRCCSDTTAHIPIALRTAWFPNIFTPGQEPNATFGPSTAVPITDYNLDIYNRRGQLVFSSDSPDVRWDGASCPQGAYPYRWSFRTPEGRIIKGHGVVTLVR